MTFSSGQVLTAAQLNDLSIDSITVDTSTLVVDKTNNRVGIGTASPDRLLDLRGASNPEIRFQSTDGSDTFIYFGDETDAVKCGIGLDTSENQLIFRGYDNNTRAFIASTGEFHIDALKVNSSGVIGNATATFSSMNRELSIINTGGVTNYSEIRSHADGNLNTYAFLLYNAYDHVWRNSNVNRMVLYNNGNLKVITGSIESDGTYANTTSSAANMHISSGGYFFRSTSSEKYKTDIETLENDYADAILNLRPVWYKSLCENDNKDFSYWGFIAEEVAEIDPRLVHYGVEQLKDENGELMFTEEETEDGIELLPVYKTDDNGEVIEAPEGVQYERLTPLLLNLIQRLTARVEALEK